MYGIDCATKITTTNAQGLKSSGVLTVGRYLGRNLWNGLTLDEVKVIHDAGLSLFLIMELSPTKSNYFSYAKGVSDAQFALTEAEYLGAPKGLTIYFTVDYDAQDGDMDAIKDYFHGIQTILTGKYLVGAYGSYRVMNALRGADYPPDRYFQTYAWSLGQHAPNHIYQYSNDVHVVGVACDQDYVNDDAGLWTMETKKESEDVLDVACVLFSKEDYWAGYDVCVKNGNCALFTRLNGTIPKDAMSSKHLIVIGGATTGHPNELLLSGNTKYDTAALVAKYLG